MDDPSLHIVLFEPEIPHNAGAVGRTCVALGAKLWLVRPLGFRVDDRRLRRAGIDYWQHLDWQVVADWDELVRHLGLQASRCLVPKLQLGNQVHQVQADVPPRGGRRPWLFSKSAGRPYTDACFEPGDVLVFGSESQGLPRRLFDAHQDRCLRIPIRPEARSLNLSVSVGIVAFEARRQWTAEGLIPPDR